MKLKIKSDLLLFRTLSVCGLLAIFSCKKFVEVDPPINQVNTAPVYSSDATATSAVNGLYSTIMNDYNGLLNGGVSLYSGLSSDELVSTSTSQDDIAAFQTNSLQSTNSIAAALWSNGYNYIYQTNALLEGLAHSQGVSPSTLTQLTGEAKFLRALTYFYLVNLFGDVPLITSTDFRQNARQARNAKVDIYVQIISDLENAESQLPAAYVGSDRTRPNKWAISALLARVYLYQKNWAKAEAKANEVIGSGVYTLEPTNPFTYTSNETIFQIIPVSPYANTAEGSDFVPFSSTDVPFYILSNNLMTSFETGDTRVGNWIGTNMVGTTAYNYPSKYQNNSGPPYTEYNIVLRLAEQYLIRAEARAQQNNLNGTKDDLNAVRARSGLGQTTDTDQASLLAAITHERQVELFGEWGHRWLDLLRTGKADAVLAPIKGTAWQPTDQLYPIPYSQLKANPQLVQNIGY
ncbi:MAG: RagB/SusD family nutrient uptake outer membrane protein [Flavisolibacter sp.]